MKLHLGCGDRYLDGYINIDLKVSGYTVYASMDPIAKKTNLATMYKYYPEYFTREDMCKAATAHKGGSPLRKCVVDLSGDIRKLSNVLNSYDGIVLPITEIVMVQVLEHFSMDDGLKVLEGCYEVLAPGGILHLDLPDFVAGVHELTSTSNMSVNDEEFLYRHFFGSQKNVNAYHLNGFSVARISRILKQVGFAVVVDVTQNYKRPRCYPYFIVEAKKVTKGD